MASAIGLRHTFAVQITKYPVVTPPLRPPRSSGAAHAGLLKSSVASSLGIGFQK